MSTRRRHNSSDRTRNLQHTRLLIAWSENRTIKRLAHSRKEVRSVVAQYVRSGATVTEQTVGQWGIYRTVRVHQPGERKESTS